MALKRSVNCRRTPKSMRCFLTATDGFCLLVFGVSAVVCCEPPGQPDRGYYVPVAQKYQPGDKVRYVCRPGSSLIGKEFRTCKFGGMWTDTTPFCDFPVNFERAIISSTSSSSDSCLGAERTIDANESTCVRTNTGTGEYVRIFLDKPSVVLGIRAKSGKGDTRLSIYTERHFNRYYCDDHRATVVMRSWTTFPCASTSLSDDVYILNEGTTSSFEICEVQVYVRGSTGVWCPQSARMYEPIVWLDEMNREKAKLQCTEMRFPYGIRGGFVCISSVHWSDGILICEEVFCDAPPKFSVGVWYPGENSDKMPVGRARQLKCPGGYTVVGGPDVIVCRPDGSWSPSSVRCEAEVRTDSFSFSPTLPTPSSQVQEDTSIAEVRTGSFSFSTTLPAPSSQVQEDTRIEEIRKDSLSFSPTSSSQEDGNMSTVIITSATVSIFFLVVFAFIVFSIYKRRIKPVVVVAPEINQSAYNSAVSECPSVVHDATVPGTHLPRQHLSSKNANYSESQEIYASLQDESLPTHTHVEVHDPPGV